MTIGIQAFNDAGNLQISADYKNFAVKEIKRKVRGTPISHNGVFLGIKPDISYSNARNICSPYTRSEYNFGKSTAYVFDLAERVIHNSEYGLEVFDATGKLAFSSSLRYTRVIDSSFKQKQAGNGERIWVEVPGITRYEGKRYTMNYGHPNIAVVFLNSYLEENDDYWMGDWWKFSLLSAVEIKLNNDVVISDFYEFTQPDNYTPPPDVGYRGGHSSSCEWLVIDTSRF